PSDGESGLVAWDNCGNEIDFVVVICRQYGRRITREHNADKAIKPSKYSRSISHLSTSKEAARARQIEELRAELAAMRRRQCQEEEVQAEEFQYQLSQNEIFDGQQLAEVLKSYCYALEELKRMNNEIEERHIEEMNLIAFQIRDLKKEHKKRLNHLATQYSERMLIEYQKFFKLRESKLELRENYEAKLKKSAGKLQDTVEGLELDYKKQLHERKGLIRDLMKEMKDKKVEFIAYCRQVEGENDRNKAET
ncbi:hypothetical protein GQX74_006076, partial [Glossina fuscipes]